MEILVFDTSYVQDRKEKNIGKKNFGKLAEQKNRNRSRSCSP